MINRKIEKILAIVTASLVLVWLGGFSLIVTNIEYDQYQNVIAPNFAESIPNIYSQEGFESVRSLASWFGFTAFLSLFPMAIGVFFIDKYPKRAALAFLIAGLIVLFGSQLIAYPLAFIYFVIVALALLRKETTDESEEIILDEN